MRSISCHITLLVINCLEGRHTHASIHVHAYAHTHADIHAKQFTGLKMNNDFHKIFSTCDSNMTECMPFILHIQRSGRNLYGIINICFNIILKIQV